MFDRTLSHISARKMRRYQWDSAVVLGLCFTSLALGFPTIRLLPVPQTPKVSFFPGRLQRTGLFWVEPSRPSAFLAQRSFYFEENQGQFDRSGKFRTRHNGQQVWLMSNGLDWKTNASPAQMASIQMRLVGSNAEAKVQGLERLPGSLHYLRANRQYASIATYSKVQYRGIYPGIDLIYYFSNQQLEYDFIVAPGADPNLIRLAFHQVAQIHLEENGDLILHTQAGYLRQQKPIAYQMIEGEKREVTAKFRRISKREVKFEVGAYDPTQPLLIDPTLSFSSYLGGSDFDIGTSIALDSSGNIYVAGTANSADFPVSPSAYQKDLRDSDIFITKFDPTGKTVLYSTFIGGSSTENTTRIAVDTAGNVYVTGSTASSDFPTTAGAYRRNVEQGEAFVAKLNSTGSALVFSTLLGGSGNDIGNGLAVDGTNNVYVAGTTTSANFPTTGGVFQPATRGGSFEAFVTKLNPTGTQLIYSSYLGGNSNDEVLSLAVDSSGQAFLTGYTFSANFPTTAGVYQATFNGAGNASDAFIAKINATGSALIYATYLGGKANDVAQAIAIDVAGNAYVTGTTIGAGNDFPTTSGAFQRTFRGSSIPGPVSDAFITKLNPTGSVLGYSTYLGGNGADQAFGIAVNGQGMAVVTGSTSSNDFPATTDGVRIYAGAIDAFVAQLDADGATVPYATYLGGAGNDTGAAIALDTVGNIYLTGNTASVNFPVFPSAYQAVSGGGRNAFFAALKDTASLLATSVTGASYRAIPMARESIVSVFGNRLATRTQPGEDSDPNTPGFQLPTTLAGTTVKVKDREGVERLAPLFFVSPTQVNYQIPPGTPLGGALVTVTAEDGTVSIGTIQVVEVAPDLFSANSTGSGPAIGNVVRVKAGGAQSEESLAHFVNEKWELIPLDLGPPTDEVFLILFGTGIRFRKDPPQVSATIGGATARVDYAKNQCCFVGLDQINLLIPRSLVGRGEVEVIVTVDGQPTLPLKLAIK